MPIAYWLLSVTAAMKNYCRKLLPKVASKSDRKPRIRNYRKYTVCNTCSDKDTCTSLTCAADMYDTNGDATDGCEVGCPVLVDATCDFCTDKDTCTALTCDANKFNQDKIINNGCEVGCPIVTHGTCNTCSDKDTCTKVTCALNHFDKNKDATDGCDPCDSLYGCADENKSPSSTASAPGSSEGFESGAVIQIATTTTTFVVFCMTTAATMFL